MTKLLSLCARCCLPALMLLLAAGPVHADRIKDLTTMAAMRSNQLIGSV